MQIKRFEANSMSEALQQVKRELGSDAVILSARSLKRGRGIWGKIRSSGVEVTAAMDTKPFANDRSRKYSTKTVNPHPGGQWRHQPTVSRRHQQILKSYGDHSDLVRKPSAVDQRRTATRKDSSANDDIYQLLIRQNIKKEYATEIVANLPHRSFTPTNGAVTSQVEPLANALRAAGVMSKPYSNNNDSRHILALVGPPGVGKTSTLAKLAAYFSVGANKTVACINMDNYRVAGSTQLKTYAHILGMPVVEAASRKQLTAAIKSFQNHDVVLIDTPAINRQDESSTRHFSRVLRKDPAIETLLLIDALSREEEQFDLLDRTTCLSVKRLILTKTDECISLGGTVNLLIRSGLPWSFETAGQQTMGYLKEASCHSLAEALLGEKKHTGHSEIPTQRESHAKMAGPKRHAKPSAPAEFFVANRNSDVFHTPDCKWTKMIKEDHIVVFGDMQDAEKKRFKPCRYCCPAGLPKRIDENWGLDVKKAVGYR